MRIAALLLACTALAGCSVEQDASAMAVGGEEAVASVELLSVEELAPLVATGEVVLIDVRRPDEFAEGRLPGALNAPVETFDPAAIPIEDGRETIVYCRSGNRSTRAAEMLAEHLQGKVRHVDGGIVAWQEAGGEVITSPAT